uniref:Uncharacterized protein n=1 Tax=Neogobius melanostomus TaxID=47308 RepID=A0A8C6TIV6_9GOBI
MARCDHTEAEVIEQQEEDMEAGSRRSSVPEPGSPSPGADSQSSSRLLAYSDALISIIATVMVSSVHARAHTHKHTHTHTHTRTPTGPCTPGIITDP